MAKTKTAKTQKIKKPARRNGRKARTNAGKTAGATKPKTRKLRKPPSRRHCGLKPPELSSSATIRIGLRFHPGHLD